MSRGEDEQSARFGRRALLAGGASVVLAACTSSEVPPDEVSPNAEPAATTTTSAPVPVAAPAYDGENPFTLGVASGDPDSNSVVLWTRLLPDGFAAQGWSAPDQLVAIDISRTDTFDALVSSETLTATAEHGHSVHHLATNLEADTWYAYRFRVGDATSLIGWARTTPVAGASTPLTLGFSSCQFWESGAWAAHRHLSETNLDFFVWLGDYIYEYGPNDQGVISPAGPRVHASEEITDLVGYRGRYAQYKADPNLQANHAARPWIVTWDDHEVDNNHAGLTSEDEADVEAFAERKRAAYKAWWEHMPVRLGPPTDTAFVIHRVISWGSLLKLHMLDGRQYRDDQPTDGEPIPGLDGFGAQSLGPTALDPDHSMLGAEQESWLVAEIEKSPATWNVLGNQVYMHGITAFPGAAAINPDSWDGYFANREQLLERLDEVNSGHLVVLTGDFHAASVAVVRTDPFDLEGPPVATEFMAPAISSVFPAQLRELAPIAIGFNPHIKHFDPDNGFMTCTITEDEWTTTVHILEDVTDETSGIRDRTDFSIAASEVGVIHSNGQSA